MHAFRRILVTLLALAALLGIGASWIMAAPSGGFHQGAMACEACHLAGKAVTRDQAHLLVASQEKLCGNCHQATAQVSHPSGLLPRNKLPADYPVDWKGDLTCSTCHEVHGKNPGILRGDRRGRELCPRVPSTSSGSAPLRLTMILPLANHGSAISIEPFEP